MKLAEAKTRLEQFINRPFGSIFMGANYDWIINKGKAGQVLEIVLGLQNTPNPLDFEDGELKTNKCDAHGNPKETVFISQILSVIDDMFRRKPFEESHLCHKISNMLYVPVSKDGEPRDWMFLKPIHIDLNEPRFADLKRIWRDDYYSICEQLKRHVETSHDGFIHTSNGRHIQVRSKDSQPYHPIYSTVYGRFVSNKNHAFYFQKQFVYDIKSMAAH
jgi:DNA mismatch repair protein MutH